MEIMTDPCEIYSSNSLWEESRWKENAPWEFLLMEFVFAKKHQLLLKGSIVAYVLLTLLSIIVIVSRSINDTDRGYGYAFYVGLQLQALLYLCLPYLSYKFCHRALNSPKVLGVIVQALQFDAIFVWKAVIIARLNSSVIMLSVVAYVYLTENPWWYIGFACLYTAVFFLPFVCSFSFSVVVMEAHRQLALSLSAHVGQMRERATPPPSRAHITPQDGAVTSPLEGHHYCREGDDVSTREFERDVEIASSPAGSLGSGGKSSISHTLMGGGDEEGSLSNDTEIRSSDAVSPSHGVTVPQANDLSIEEGSSSISHLDISSLRQIYFRAHDKCRETSRQIGKYFLFFMFVSISFAIFSIWSIYVKQVQWRSTATFVVVSACMVMELGLAIVAANETGNLVSVDICTFLLFDGHRYDSVLSNEAVILLGSLAHAKIEVPFFGNFVFRSSTMLAITGSLVAAIIPGVVLRNI